MPTETIEVHEAQTRLPELVAQAIAGAEVVLTEGAVPLVRLVPVTRSTSISRVAGLHNGAITTSEDFDVPLPDDFWTGTS